jgi:glucose-6-phosphate isomerase
MKLRKNTLFPIRFEYLEALLNFGIQQSQIDSVFENLEGIRQSVLSSMTKSEDTPEFAFVGFPERSLHEYAQSRTNSQLGKVFKRANRWHSLVDRVVILGCGSACTGAKAMVDSCCQPYWNELSRADRGCKPRVYFEGDSFDNDSLQGLLHLLEVHKGQVVKDELDRWALLMAAPSNTHQQIAKTNAAFFHLSKALANSVADDQHSIAELNAIVFGNNQSQQDENFVSLGGDSFTVPDNLQGPFSLFSPIGLLPAALVGINVMELLAGATHMTQHFRTFAAKENLVLQLVAFTQLLRQHKRAQGLTVRLWSKSLLSFGKWYEQFSAEIAKETNTMQKESSLHRSELHSVAHSQATDDPIDAIVNISTEQWRFDTLEFHASSTPSRSYTQAMQEALASENGRGSAANLVLSKIDELHMGQLFQLWMLASMLESQWST